MTILQKLFGFQGRLRRRDYWLLTLLFAVVTGLLEEGIYRAVFGGRFSLFNGTATTTTDAGVLAVQFALTGLSAWTQFAMSVKRAHDCNRSGRTVAVVLALFYFMVFAQGVLMTAPPALPDGGIWVGLALLAGVAVYGGVGLYLLITVGIRDGTPGTNKYGPSPKGAASATYMAPAAD